MAPQQTNNQLKTDREERKGNPIFFKRKTLEYDKPEVITYPIPFYFFEGLTWFRLTPTDVQDSATPVPKEATE